MSSREEGKVKLNGNLIEVKKKFKCLGGWGPIFNEDRQLEKEINNRIQAACGLFQKVRNLAWKIPLECKKVN